jgi:hypothetical protein
MTTDQPTPKPVVRYRGMALPYRTSALLESINHPTAHNGGLHVSITSKVLSWDRGTGRIETLNTVYLPEEKAS